MKKITDALGLPEGADEDAILAAIVKLQTPAPETPSAKLEKRIRQKMSQSAGALNYEQAALVVKGQDEQDAARRAGATAATAASGKRVAGK